MALCTYCKNEGQKTNACAYCGTLTSTGMATFIYGFTEKESYGCEFTLTDKYFIVKGVSQKEMAASSSGAAFGLVGALIVEAARDEMAKKKPFAFYDLAELQKVIYPYHTKKLKKDTAFKFVNKDGSDFVLYFNLNGLFSGKSAKTFLAALAKSGVYVENGANAVNNVCCEKPLVNKDTLGTRVCQSAATFVRMNEKQFIAPAVLPVEQSPQYEQPMQQPVYQAPMQEAVQATPVQQPVYQQPEQPQQNADTGSWQSAWDEDVQAAESEPVIDPVIEPIVENQNLPINDTPTEDRIMCPNCGFMVKSTSKFCSGCGKPLEQQEETVDPSVLEEVANIVYPGMGVYYRDINLPAQFAEKYTTDLIIREKGMTDASNRLGGMVTTHRYVILSNHMGNLSAFEHGTNWGLRVAAKDSHFKVLGKHTYKDKTGIFLLHLPDDEKWKIYKTATFNIDEEVLQSAIQNFEQRIDAAPIPEVTSENWLARCAFPVGMSDNGELWELE